MAYPLQVTIGFLPYDDLNKPAIVAACLDPAEAATAQWGDRKLTYQTVDYAASLRRWEDDGYDLTEFDYIHMTGC